MIVIEIHNNRCSEDWAATAILTTSLIIWFVKSHSVAHLSSFRYFSHLEHSLEGRKEYLIETLPILCTALNSRLEIILCSPLFQFSWSHNVFHFCRIILLLPLVSQIHLGANKNARAWFSSCFDLSNPLRTCLLEWIFVNKTEAHKEAISISICNWS